MRTITFDYTYGDIEEYEMDYMEGFVEYVHKTLHYGRGLGNQFIGWLDLPINYDKDEFNRIKRTAEKIRRNSDVLIVVAIGGSYLGTRAVIEALGHSFYNLLEPDKRGPQILFAGNNLSSTYLGDLLELIKDKDISINVVSKSGTTLEPLIAFRSLKKHMEENYGKLGAKDRIYITTGNSKGVLRRLAEREGYETFTIPKDIGGRYSVLTPVGLLPMAVVGINIDKLMAGASFARSNYLKGNIGENPCYQYAVARNILYRRGKIIEVLANYEPTLYYLCQWWMQLYGESEGKDGKGIFPASLNFSADLHSMGQYLQDGMRNIFVTVINIEEPIFDIKLEVNQDNLDGLNYLGNKTLDYVNKKAFEGTLLAHVDGGVPNLIINVPTLNEFYLGQLIYFFQKACSISGYILGVNPFNQPGVEAYKENMFSLLGKPGYEKATNRLHRKKI